MTAGTHALPSRFSSLHGTVHSRRGSFTWISFTWIPFTGLAIALVLGARLGIKPCLPITPSYLGISPFFKLLSSVQVNQKDASNVPSGYAVTLQQLPSLQGRINTLFNSDPQSLEERPDRSVRGSVPYYPAGLNVALSRTMLPALDCCPVSTNAPIRLFFGLPVSVYLGFQLINNKFQRPLSIDLCARVRSN